MCNPHDTDLALLTSSLLMFPFATSANSFMTVLNSCEQGGGRREEEEEEEEDVKRSREEIM